MLVVVVAQAMFGTAGTLQIRVADTKNGCVPTRLLL